MHARTFDSTELFKAGECAYRRPWARIRKREARNVSRCEIPIRQL